MLRAIPVRWRVLVRAFRRQLRQLLPAERLVGRAPSIQDEFGYSNQEIGWILNAFNISYTLLMIPGGDLRRALRPAARTRRHRGRLGHADLVHGLRAGTHGGLGDRRDGLAHCGAPPRRRVECADLPDHDRPDRGLVSAGTLGASECADELGTLARAGGARPDRDGADRAAMAGARRSTSWRRRASLPASGGTGTRATSPRSTAPSRPTSSPSSTRGER